MSDVCPRCGKVHAKNEGTGVFFSKEEGDDLQLIINALSNVKQSLDPRNIPEDATQSQVDMWVQANQRILSGYQVLEKEWWERCLERYKEVLPNDRQYTVNMHSREFLHILE